VDFGVEQRGIS